jgi:hypothetical protein
MSDYTTRITELNAGLTEHQNSLQQFLGIANFLYNDLGLIGEVHSRINGENISYELHLIDRQPDGVLLVKKVNADGSGS